MIILSPEDLDIAVIAITERLTWGAKHIIDLVALAENLVEAESQYLDKVITDAEAEGQADVSEDGTVFHAALRFVQARRFRGDCVTALTMCEEFSADLTPPNGRVAVFYGPGEAFQRTIAVYRNLQKVYEWSLGDHFIAESIRKREG